MKKLTAIILVLFLSCTAFAQKPQIFLLRELYSGFDPIAGFISLSDVNILSEDPDSSALPDLDSLNVMEPFGLHGIYRDRFFNGTGISEADHLFIYDLTEEIMLDLPVKNIEVTACPNTYMSENDESYSQADFMIGFRIEKPLLRSLSKHYHNCFVAIGRENPFLKGGLKRVTWSKTTDVAEIPRQEIIGQTGLGSPDFFDVGNAYEYSSNGLHYFVQEILLNEKGADIFVNGDIYALQLRITDSKTNELITERLFISGEGSSPAPLNNDYLEGGDYTYQWEGKLLKDLPPVIFSFEYLSFDCPSMIVAEKSAEDIYINCDSRH